MLTPKLTLPTITQELSLNTIRASRSLGDYENALTRFSNRISNLGVSMSLAVSIPLQIVSASVVKTYADIEQAAMRSAALVRGSNQQFASGFADMAMTMSQRLPVTAQEILRTTEELQKMGMTALEAWANVEEITKYSIVGQFEDTAKAGADAASIMGIYGMSTGDVAGDAANLIKVMDVLTLAAQETNADVDEMVQGMKTYGAWAKLTGRDIYSTAATIGMYHQQLLKGSRAGTLFGMSTRDIANKALENAEAYKKLGIEVFDINGKMNSQETILKQLETALAGASDQQKIMMVNSLGWPDRAKAATLALMGTSAELGNLTNKLKTTNEVYQQQFELLSTGVNFQLGIMRNQISFVAYSLGQQMIPYVQKAITFIEGLVIKFKSLSEEQRNQIVKWILIGAAAGPVVLVFGLLTRLITLALFPLNMLSTALTRHLLPALWNASSALVMFIVRLTTSAAAAFSASLAQTGGLVPALIASSRAIYMGARAWMAWAASTMAAAWPVTLTVAVLGLLIAAIAEVTSRLTTGKSTVEHFGNAWTWVANIISGAAGQATSAVQGLNAAMYGTGGAMEKLSQEALKIQQDYNSGAINKEQYEEQVERHRIKTKTQNPLTQTNALADFHRTITENFKIPEDVMKQGKDAILNHKLALIKTYEEIDAIREGEAYSLTKMLHDQAKMDRTMNPDTPDPASNDWEAGADDKKTKSIRSKGWGGTSYGTTEEYKQRVAANDKTVRVMHDQLGEQKKIAKAADEQKKHLADISKAMNSGNVLIPSNA